MRNICYAITLFILCAVFPPAVCAQSGPDAPARLKELRLDGPRFGLTMLGDGVRARLREEGIDVNAAISQFGWQFERQFYSKDGGLTAVNEWVLLVGGLDQGTAIPSLNWLVGLRTREGAEFGIGPNVTPAGVALAVSAGVTFRSGNLNIPMNFAVVPARAGTRVSILTGFTLRH